MHFSLPCQIHTSRGCISALLRWQSLFCNYGKPFIKRLYNALWILTEKLHSFTENYPCFREQILCQLNRTSLTHAQSSVTTRSISKTTFPKEVHSQLTMAYSREGRVKIYNIINGFFIIESFYDHLPPQGCHHKLVFKFKHAW